MSDIELIKMINKSTKPSDIFKGDDWKKTYLNYSKQIHPDYHPNSLAAEAMTKINQYKDILENGIPYVDEAGAFRVFQKKIEYDVTDVNRKLLLKSVNNFKLLKLLTDKSSLSFHRYMPEDMVFNKSGDKLTITLKDRAIPLTGLQLPQQHINWLFSRMFEYVLWLRQSNYTHLGFNPTTVFVVPETHGIIVINYYHMTVVNNKAETISAKYKMWYPTTLFTKKIATPDIDLELCKKIALYLLGDKSAAGTKLRKDKNVNQNMLNFLLIKHKNVREEYIQYRELLKLNFESEFIPLDL